MNWRMLGTALLVSVLTGCSTASEPHTVFQPTEVIVAEVSAAKEIQLPARPVLAIVPATEKRDSQKVKIIQSNLQRVSSYAQQLENLILEYNKAIRRNAASSPGTQE